MTTKFVLTVAGNDVLSGGGLQADLATFTRHQQFGFVAQTCMTTVSETGFAIYPTAVSLFQQQLDSLAKVPLAGIKLGLLPTVDLAQAVKPFLAKRKSLPIVLDPVLVFKENHDQAISRMRQELRALFSLATIITPNLREAEILSGQTITTLSEMKSAAKCLHDMGASHVVIKGGVRLDKHHALDVYCDAQELLVLSQPLLYQNNNGAGCTFASSILSYLVEGEEVKTAVAKAKEEVYAAIKNANAYGVQGLPIKEDA